MYSLQIILDDKQSINQSAATGSRSLISKLQKKYYLYKLQL